MLWKNGYGELQQNTCPQPDLLLVDSIPGADKIVTRRTLPLLSLSLPPSGSTCCSGFCDFGVSSILISTQLIKKLNNRWTICLCLSDIVQSAHMKKRKCVKFFCFFFQDYNQTDNRDSLYWNNKQLPSTCILCIFLCEHPKEPLHAHLRHLTLPFSLAAN